MRKEIIEVDRYYHVFNRGVSKQKIFHCHWDYRHFEDLILKLSKKHFINFEAYCVMPNHYHLLIIDYGTEECVIPKFMHGLQMSYAKYYNHKYDHSGAVFQGKYKAKPLSCEESETKIKEYIYQNPVEAKLVKTSKDWHYLYVDTQCPLDTGCRA